MNIRAEFKFGKPSKKQWSSVFGYRPEDLTELEQLGEMYAVMRLGIDTDQFGIEKFAKLLLEELQQSYFDMREQKESKLEQLEDAAWKMKSRMEVILAREDEVQKSGVDIEMAIVVVIEDALYAVVIGESKIIVCREENIVDISEALVDLKQSGLIKSGSLQLEKHDHVALLTASGFETLGAELDNILAELNVQKLQEASMSDGGSVMLLGDEYEKWIEHESKSEKEEKREIEKEQSAHSDQLSEDQSEKEVEMPDDQDEAESPNSNKEEYEDRVEEEMVEEQEEMVQRFSTKQRSAISDQLTEEEEDVDNEELRAESRKLTADERGTSIKDKLTNIKTSAIGGLLSIKNRFTKKTVDIEETDDEGVDNNRSNLAKISNIATKVKGVTKQSVQKVKTHFDENQTTYVQVIRNLKQNVINLINKVINFFKTEIIGIGSVRRLDHKRKLKRNRWIFAIVVVVVGIALISIVNDGRNRAAQNDKKRKNEELVQTYTTQLSTLKLQAAESAASDPARKVQIIQDLNSLQKNVKDNISNSDIAIQLDTLNNQIIASLDELQLAESFTEPKIVTNITTKFSDAALQDMVFAEDFIFVADSARDVIYRVRPTLGTDPEEFVVDLKAPKLMAPDYQGSIVFYDDSATSVISKFKIADGSVARLAGLVASEVGKIDAMSIYSENGALYEVHQNNKQIFKRDTNADSFVGGGALPAVSPPTNWKTAAVLGEAIDIKVQYYVYALIQGVGIERYLGGGDNTLSQATYSNLLPQDFNALKNASSFDVVSPYMAVGDPINKRILLFQILDDEQGTVKFIKQYIYRGSENILTEIKQIAINTNSGHIYALDNGKILRFDLPQI